MNNKIPLQSVNPSDKRKGWVSIFRVEICFSTTNGHITDEVINEYINSHIEAHQPTSISNIRLE